MSSADPATSVVSQDCASVLSKLVNSLSSANPAAIVNLSTTTNNTAAGTNQTSSKKNKRKKSKSPRHRKNRNDRSKSPRTAVVAPSGGQMQQVQQSIQQQPNHSTARRMSNSRNIKFSLPPENHPGFPANYLRVQRVYTNSGFNRGSNRNRTLVSNKPGMSNDFVSHEIMAYYHRNRQSNDKYKSKQILRQSLENTLKQTFPQYFINLHIIGSTTNGIGDNVSTVDICVLALKKHQLSVTNYHNPTSSDTAANESKDNSSSDEKINQSPSNESNGGEEKVVKSVADSSSMPDDTDEISLNNIEKVLKTKNFVQDITLIPAKVPVIKFKDSICHLNVTLNLNQDVSIRNTQLIRDYSKMDWRFPQLALIVKQWARENRINSAVEKSISPYSWTLMVIHYLQVVDPPVLPCLQKTSPKRYDANVHNEEEIRAWRQPIQWHSKNNSSLKQLLKGIFRYYGDFDYEQNIISVREGKALNRMYLSNRPNGSFDDNYMQWKALICVEEPFTLSNTTRSVHEQETFERIKELLRMSSNALKGNRLTLFNIIVDDLDFPIKY